MEKKILEDDFERRIVNEWMWKSDCEGKIVEQKIVKERLWREDYERKRDCERKTVKGRSKDRKLAKS